MKIIDQTFQVIPQSSSVTSKTQRKNCPTMIPGSYPNTSQNHPNRSQRAPKRHLKGTLGEALDPKPTNTAHLPFSDFFCHPKGAQRSPFEEPMGTERYPKSTKNLFKKHLESRPRKGDDIRPKCLQNPLKFDGKAVPYRGRRRK